MNTAHWTNSELMAAPVISSIQQRSLIVGGLFAGAAYLLYRRGQDRLESAEAAGGTEPIPES